MFSGKAARSTRRQPCSCLFQLTNVSRRVLKALRRVIGQSLELAVIAFFQGIEQIGGGVCLTVILDLIIALGFYD